MSREAKIKDLQDRISAAYHKETSESIPALVTELNALQLEEYATLHQLPKPWIVEA